MRLLLLAGCFVSGDLYDTKADRDGDGHVSDALPGGDDCADDRPDIYPGAFESCLDSIDSDCDGKLCPDQILVEPGVDERLLYGSRADSFLQVSAVLDMDGDGRLEVVLSEPRLSRVDDNRDDPEETAAGVGRVHIASLDASGEIDAEAIATLEAPAEGGLWAHRVGDLDGDGDQELAVTTISGELKIWLLDDLPRDSGPIEGLADATINASGDQRDEEDNSGDALFLGDVQAAGDWDGDGRDDFVVMSPDGGDEDRGHAYLITDGIEGGGRIEDVYAARVEGSGRRDRLGGEVGAAPDIDGDGRPDILLSAPSSNFVDQRTNTQLSPSVGAAYIFTGLPGDDVEVDDATTAFYGVYQGAPMLWSGGLGDLNGDGYDDVGLHVASGPGDLFIFFDARGQEAHYFEDADIRLFGDGGEITTSSFGAQATGGFDLDADGFGDIIVAAPREGYGGLGDRPGDAGAAYLYYGPVSGVFSPDHAAVRWVGAEAGGQLGYAAVADLDRDDRLDLLLSAPGTASPNDSDEYGHGEVFFLSDLAGR